MKPFTDSTVTLVFGLSLLRTTLLRVHPGGLAATVHDASSLPRPPPGA